MTTSVPTLPKALQARLAAIMAARPNHVCGAHWLQYCEGMVRVEVLSCACRKPTTGIEARLLHQQTQQRRRSTAGPFDCCLVTPEAAAQHGHPPLPDVGCEPYDAELRGKDDLKALGALRKRAMKPVYQTIEADGESH